jgi:diguanylate cyclase (GGDEF)-like protein
MKSLAVVGDDRDTTELLTAAAALGITLAPDAPVVIATAASSADALSALRDGQRFAVIGASGSMAPRVDAVLLPPVGREVLTAVLSALSGGMGAPIPAAKLGATTTLGDTGIPGAERALASAFRADECVITVDDGRPVDTIPIVGTNDSRAALPLRTGAGEIVGALRLRWDGPHCPTENEREAMRAVGRRLAEEISISTRLRQLSAENARLRAAALVDEVTGVWSHEHFLVVVATEVGAARRRSEPITLAVFDIRGLAAINASHGHDVGDQVLNHVAATLRGNVRGHDVVGRIGDDEFAVLLLGAPTEASAIVAQKLVRNVAETPLVREGLELRAQLSAGLAAIAYQDEAADIIARARNAARRNRQDEPGHAPAPVEPSGEVVIEVAPAEGMPAGTMLGGRYRILHELRRGEIGVTYRAHDVERGREVAVKVLRADVAGEHRARLDQLADELQSLRHPSFADVFALRWEGEDAYFVSALVEGESVGRIVARLAKEEAWLPLDAVVEIAVQIGAALDTLASRGVVHGGVRPDLIVITPEDKAVLADVGLPLGGSHLDTGPDGPAGFAAPELGDDEPTPAADVYSLGATVYTLLTGVPPFSGPDDATVLAQQLADPPLPPSSIIKDLPRAVDAVVLRALSPLARDRQPTAGTFADELAAALSRAPATRTEPRPPTPQPRLARNTEERAQVASPIPTVGPAAHIRGAIFRAAQRVLATRVSTAWIARTARDVPTLAEVLSPQLAPTAWHPLAHFVDLLEKSRGGRVVVEGLARQIGRATVDSSFTRFFAADLPGLTPEAALRAAPLFWPRYHSWSRVKVQVERKDRIRVLVTGDPIGGVTGEMVGGMLVRIAELAGARGLTLWQQPWSLGPGAENVVAIEWRDVERQARR